MLAEFGPGTQVSDRYATRLLAEHSLPPSAKVLRWSDPSRPGTDHHVVLADGKVVERTVWDSRAK